MLVVYYSSGSEYTHKFVNKLDHPGLRLPLLTKEPTPIVGEPFVLITPTYGAGKNRGAVPKQVVKFLNVEENRNRLVGVIGAGNTNFGEAYCAAGDIIAAKCKVPYLYRYELMGTPEDTAAVRNGLVRFFTEQ